MTTSLQLTGPRQAFIQRSHALYEECENVCELAQKGVITDLLKISIIELDLIARRLIKELAQDFDVSTAKESLEYINEARACLLKNKLGFTSELSAAMGFSRVAESLLRIKQPTTRTLDLLMDHMQIKITDADKAEVYRALAELVPGPSGTDPIAHGKAMLESQTVSNAVRAQALINAGAKLDKVTLEEKENKTAFHDTAKKTDEAGFTAQKHMSSSSSSSSFSSSSLSSDSSSFSFAISRTDSSSVGELPQTHSDAWKRLDSLLPKPLFRYQTPTVSSDTPLNKEKPSEAPVSTTITVETTTVATTLEPEAQTVSNASVSTTLTVATTIVVTTVETTTVANTLEPEAQTSFADAEKSKEDLTQI